MHVGLTGRLKEGEGGICMVFMRGYQTWVTFKFKIGNMHPEGSAAPFG